MARQSSSVAQDTRTALDAFRRIIQSLRVASRGVERDLGISTAQLFALQQIGAAPGTSVNDVAARTFTHQSSVSVVVQRLVRQKLVVKTSAREDRRRLVLELTDRGRRLLARAPEPVQDRLVAGIGALRDGERRTFVRALSSVARAVSGNGEAPPMFFEEGRPAHRAGRAGSRARSRR